MPPLRPNKRKILEGINGLLRDRVIHPSISPERDQLRRVIILSCRPYNHKR
jgi:hypothetical protein